MDEEGDDKFVQRAERKAKQTFLKEEILDSGYNPEAFTDFCESHKGADIDKWTFEEL
jgi:hypothetical protein